ncbi:hypothetical protein PVAND_017709 [Polypedilum vanderplanki]|uniref:Uncharacterized protein n=1 Tax=Polypedilum vanderplanki TaxID=319348 RepID=A0A9J6B921_POLVA|nr:hypothetical protein PVAND_017709 [Polypedilum vanderplanki]
MVLRDICGISLEVIGQIIGWIGLMLNCFKAFFCFIISFFPHLFCEAIEKKVGYEGSKEVAEFCKNFDSAIRIFLIFTILFFLVCAFVHFLLIQGIEANDFQLVTYAWILYMIKISWSIINILGCITTSQVLFGLQFISFSFSINNVGTNIFSNLIELGMYVFCGMVIHSLRENYRN